MRKEKPLLLDEIREKIDSSKAMIVAKYDKLEPNTSWAFRGLLRSSGSQFEVVKKRLFIKATKDAGIGFDSNAFTGHIAVVFVGGEDAMPAAKTVFKFSEENGNLLQVICSHFEGRIIPGTELEELSKLPGMDEMRAILLALFMSPMSQMLSVMEAAIAGPLGNKSES